MIEKENKTSRRSEVSTSQQLLIINHSHNAYTDKHNINAIVRTVNHNSDDLISTQIPSALGVLLKVKRHLYMLI